MPANQRPIPPSAEYADASQTHQAQGFWLGLRLPPGFPERDQVQMQRNLEDHLADLGLRIGGGAQRHLYIEAADLELTIADQVDLADWCLLATAATQISVTSFTSSHVMPPVTAKVLRIDRWDLATMSVSLLYRMGRIRAEQYAEILGGFLADPNGELFA